MRESTGVISALSEVPLKLCVAVGSQRGYVMQINQYADIVGGFILV